MCFKREKCEILCKQYRRVASILGSLQGSPSPIPLVPADTLQPTRLLVWSGAKTHRK